MKESERILERAYLEIMLKNFTKEQRLEIQDSIDEVKTILKSEIINFETIALLIFLYRKKLNENILQ